MQVDSLPIELSGKSISEVVDISPNLETSVIAQLVKNLPTMQETLVRFLGQKDMLEKG